MAGLAAIIDRGPAGSDRVADVGRMLRSVPHRCRDGLVVRRASPRAVLGHGRFRTLPVAREVDQPYADPAEQTWITADARIDNRDELARALAGVPWLPPDTPDAALILAGYVLWGDSVVDHLVGDFAFVIWDESQGHLLAARDPSTLRPLFYHHRPGRSLAFASEPPLLLSLGEISSDPDPLMVGEFLGGIDHRDPTRSEFREIRRLAGGHTLVADADMAHVRVSRFWSPTPTADRRWSSEAECREELVDLLREVVKARVESDRPALGLVSGGYDSATIVAILDQLQKRGELQAAQIELAYRSYDGLGCDESPYILAVLDRAQFGRRPIIAEPFGFEDAASHIASRMSFSAANPRQFSIAFAPTAHAAGTRVVLRGDGGDQLFTEGQVDTDLLDRGMWFQHLKEIWFDRHRGMPGPLPHRCRRLAGAAKRLVCGPRFGSSVAAGNPGIGPSYLTEDCRRVIADELSPRDWPPIPPEYPSLLQRDMWSMVAAGIDEDRYIENLSLEGHYCGMEYRTPFYDVRLVRFMLDVPFELRIPNGVFKSFLTRTMGEMLPVAIARRNNKTRIYAHLAETLNRWRGEMLSTLFGGDFWRSGQFVDRGRARQFIEAIDPTRAIPGNNFEATNKALHRINLAWHIAAVELWMRGLDA